MILTFLSVCYTNMRNSPMQYVQPLNPTTTYVLTTTQYFFHKGTNDINYHQLPMAAQKSRLRKLMEVYVQQVWNGVSSWATECKRVQSAFLCFSY